MKGWVIDSSLALSWGLPNEDSRASDRILRTAEEGVALWVPALWWYEVANAILTAQRRKRLTEAEGLRLIELYRGLPLETDAYSGPEALWRYTTLAQEHGLTSYDAVYLELAERRGLGLASFDRKLIQAARKAGVQTQES